MTSGRTISDEELVAYLDGELDAARRSEVGAALDRDGALRARLDELEIDKAALRTAFDRVAAEAPIARLRKGLERASRTRRRPSRQWLRIAAALLLGAALGYALRFATVDEEVTDWHVAVAGYHALYTTATLASIAGDPANARREVGAVAAKLGFDIELEALQIPGLEFKRAQILEFKGKPVAQFAYLDAAGIPVAICATRTREVDAAIRTGNFRGLPAAYWSKNGYGFIVIGATNVESLERIAAAFARHT
jgi:anti-sigma factor RsiW